MLPWQAETKEKQFSIGGIFGRRLAISDFVLRNEIDKHNNGSNQQTHK